MRESLNLIIIADNIGIRFQLNLVTIETNWCESVKSKSNENIHPRFFPQKAWKSSPQEKENLLLLFRHNFFCIKKIAS